MKQKSNLRFIRGLINRDEKIIASIYRKVFPLILDHVSFNNGTYQDAEDVFQEGMLIVLEKIKDEKLNLTCRFTTYFTEICKKVWLKELRKRRRKEKDGNFYVETTDAIRFESDIERQQVQLCLKHFRNLSKDCQKVLLLHFEKTSLRDITAIMGYKSLQTCQDKKYRCKKRLMELIMKDPEFSKLKHELFIID